MSAHLRGLFRVSMVAIVLAYASAAALAQTVTTGTLSGVVSDEQGGVLPGATVVGVHEPTGTRYEALTSSDGRFTIPGVRVGGPYTVTVTLAGFRDQTERGVNVALGEDRHVVFALRLQSVTETVTVTASLTDLDLARAGTAANVPQQAIETLPTISRSLIDFARLSPHFSVSATNADVSFLTVAGRPHRYNNIQIDGAVNNDVFAISDSVTPGGSTDTQPVSLDAIQELQLVVAPYDVRQGGFSGGGVNAITKSGTNQLRGTVYYFGRNQDLVGDGADNRPIGQFTDRQYGASLGGRIVTNRAFFFGNFDGGRRKTPTGFSIDGTSGQKFGYEAEAARFRSILRDRYGYDPGGFEEFTRSTTNDKVFARADFNLTGSHHLTARHNYVKGFSDRGFPDSDEYLFPDFYFRFRNKTNSTVVQLNSSFGRFYNEFRFTNQIIRDRRDAPRRFPRVEVNLPGAELRAGTENFSTANELDQDVREITNDLSLVHGSHSFVMGTHNEFFTFRNLFIRDNFGTYEFDSLDLLEQGLAQAFDYSFSLTGDPRQAARFKVRQLGFYAGDQWRVRSNLTLTYGVRFDAPVFPDKPTRNPASEQFFGLRTDNVPASRMWSPRVGLNWDLSGNGTEQVRGGIGLFTGRTPYVWLSNQYGNTGIEFRRLRIAYGANNRQPFVPDPDNQPKTVGTASTNEIDMIDPNYDFPQVVRGNLGYDRNLGFWGLMTTSELVFSFNRKDVAYENLNLVRTGSAPDGRPIFGRRVASLSDVILLTNTGKGHQWSASLKVERPFSRGFYTSGSYLFNRARSINDGTSSQAASNWGNVYVPGDPNNPPLARSNFDVGHRINLGGSYNVPFGRGIAATLSLYYNGQSGRPYVPIFNGDPNNDGRFTNDILYVPRDASEIVVQNGTFADLDAYIENDECLRQFRGRIAERNCARGPWTHNLDFRAAVGVPVNSTRLEVTLDILNMLNLIDSQKGLVDYPMFNSPSQVRYGGINAATGKMTYNLAGLTSPTFRKFERDDLRSRWQAQLGVRYRF